MKEHFSSYSVISLVCVGASN